MLADDATHYCLVENLRLCLEIEVLAEGEGIGNDWLVARILRDLPLERRTSFRLSAVAAPN